VPLARSADAYVAGAPGGPVKTAAGRRARRATGGRPETLLTSNLDVFAPCATGGVLDEETARVLQAEIVCGAANNQLASVGVDELLQERKVHYAPDYVVNAGGLIQVAGEVHGYDIDTAKSKTERIYTTVRMIFEMAAAEGVLTGQAADILAERRMSLGMASPEPADRNDR
jgi:valine dehydrogenase (NAD+)